MHRQCSAVSILCILFLTCALSCTPANHISSRDCCRDLSATLINNPPPSPSGDANPWAHVENGYPRGSIWAVVLHLPGDKPRYYVTADGGHTWARNNEYESSLEKTRPKEPTVPHFSNPFDDTVRYRDVWVKDRYLIEHSLDGGKSWARIENRVKGCHATLDWELYYFHPRRPRTIYVLGSLPGDEARHRGMYVSEDAGDLFSFMYQVDLWSRGFAVSMSNPLIMYGAGLDGSLLRSTDGGENWRLVRHNDDIRRPYRLEHAGPPNDDVQSDVIYDIDIDPTDPDTVLVTCGKGVLRTLDGGRTWCILDLGITEANGIQSVAIYDKNPSVILAGTWRGLMRSTDRGCHWESIDIPARLRQ